MYMEIFKIMLSPNWSFQYGKAYYCRLKVIKNTSHEKKIMLLCVQLYLSEHIFFMYIQMSWMQVPAE